jgi:hypothetical protein
VLVVVRLMGRVTMATVHIVHVIAVVQRIVATISRVHVHMRGMWQMGSHGRPATVRQLIHVVVAGLVHMPVVEVVHMILVWDCGMAAPRIVHMSVPVYRSMPGVRLRVHACVVHVLDGSRRPGVLQSSGWRTLGPQPDGQERWTPWHPMRGVACGQDGERAGSRDHPAPRSW